MLTVALALVIGTVGLFVLFIRGITKRNANYWVKQGILQADTGSFLYRMITRDLNFVKQDTVIYEQLKGERFGGFMEFWNPVLFVTDLDLMKHIYIKDFG